MTYYFPCTGLYSLGWNCVIVLSMGYVTEELEKENPLLQDALRIFRIIGFDFYASVKKLPLFSVCIFVIIVETNQACLELAFHYENLKTFSRFNESYVVRFQVTCFKNYTSFLEILSACTQFIVHFLWNRDMAYSITLKIVLNLYKTQPKLF